MLEGKKGEIVASNKLEETLEIGSEWEELRVKVVWGPIYVVGVIDHGNVQKRANVLAMGVVKIFELLKYECCN